MAEIILNVNTTRDENDGSSEVGTGLSLRDAILLANEDSANEYIINLPAGIYNLTIANVLQPTTDESADEDTLFRSRLGTGDLDITGNVTIIGADRDTTIINAGTLDDETGIGDRVFDVLSAERSQKTTNGNLNLQNVTIQNGVITEENIDATYADGTLNGGGISIDVDTTATLINTIVENSRTVTSQGGGINNRGTLTLDRTIVRGNNSGDNAGGIYNDTNAIMAIYNSAIINNLADAAAPDIIEGGGGGVLNEIGATLIMVNTTVSGNRSASGANQSGPGDGGGGILSRGITRIINSTIVNNFAQVGSGIYSETTSANTILYNTIVGNNEDSPDIDGFFDPRSSYNLISNGNGQGILDKVNFNIVGGTGSEIINIGIGALEDNGGATPTHALTANSLAVDNGANELSGQLITEIQVYFPVDNLINGSASDQRLNENETSKTGFERIVDGNGDGRAFIDIGAYEFGAEQIEELTAIAEDSNVENNQDSNDNSGIENENDNSGDDSQTENEVHINPPSQDSPSALDTPLYRFQNTEPDRLGTYLYATEGEFPSIANYPNFVNEGKAFNVGFTPDDELISMYRFHNNEVPGTYLYVGEEEKESVLANYHNFELEGLAFYVYGADANLGQDVFRLHNNDNPGTYLFVGAEEKDQILANSSYNYSLEGVAFEANF